MKNYKYFILCIISAAIISCSKENMDGKDCSNPPCDTTAISSFLLWQEPLCSKDTSDYASMIPLLTDRGIIFSNDFCPDSKKHLNSNVFCLDKEDGSILWSIGTSQYSIVATDKRGVFRDYFWVYCGGDILIADVNTGLVRRVEDFGTGDPEVAQIGNYLYFGIIAGADSVCLLRTAIDRNHTDTLLVLHQNHPAGGIKNLLATPSLYVHSESGDSLIILQNRLVNDPYNVFAYNLRSGQIDWITKNIATDGTPKAPLVHEDRIYINGAFSVHCLDAKTGEEIWSRPDVKYTSLCNTVIHNGVLFLNSTQDDVYALSIDDGRKMWHTQAGNAGAYGVLQMHDGYLWGNIRDQYRTKITKIDPYNGDVLWKYGSHNQDFRYKASFQDGFVIDPENNSVYTNDLFFAMKLRLPK